MKFFNLCLTGLYFIAVFLTAAISLAAPISKIHVSADAKWVLHLNIEQFGPSQTYRILLNDPENGDKLKSLINHYRNLLGVDPLKALTGITLYGEEDTGNRGVAIILGAIPSKELIARLSNYPAHTVRKISGSTIHKWKDRASGADMNACLYSSGLLVITSDDTSMNSAIGTLNGSHPNLGSLKNPGLSLPTPMEGSLLTVVTRGFAGASPHPLKAMLLRNTTCTTMQVAESRGIVDANIAFAAVSSDAASQINKLLNGLIISSTFTEESSGLAKLAELSEVTRQDNLVTLRIHCPARDAAAALTACLLQP